MASGVVRDVVHRHCQGVLSLLDIIGLTLHTIALRYVLRGSDWTVVHWRHRARNLFLLENKALKFDSSGVKRRSRYQRGEFHHPYVELRKDPTTFFEYCAMLPSTFDCIVQAIRQYISQSSTNFQKTISVEEKQHASQLSRFIQFRGGAISVHWMFAAFVMTDKYIGR
jgi:deoxyribodipyrimidine photolyase